MRRLAIVLAVLVGGLTAAPGTAFAHGPLHSTALTHGYEADFYVTPNEAIWWTAMTMAAPRFNTARVANWHGGYLRSNVRRRYCGDGYCWTYLNVRSGDGSLFISYTRVDGYGQTWVTVWHQ